VDKAKYPFLPQSRQHIANLGLDIVDLAATDGVVDRARERITETYDFLIDNELHEPYKKTEVEIASFPVAVIVIASVKDKTLIERYALSEAQKINKYLSKERDETIIKIAKYFKWDIQPTKQSIFPYTIHFANYLNSATKGRLVYSPKWKLVNRQLDKGRVSVTRKEVCRLLQEEIKAYIEDHIRALSKESIIKTPDNIQILIEEIKAEYNKIKPQLTEFDPLVKAEESEYPPCIRNLFQRVGKAQHLSHTERFTLVTYLLHQGVSTDAILNLFSNVTDFKEKKTRYQIEHLAGKRGSRTPYRTYGCPSLQTHGVCVNPDAICKRIRNPLTYHLRKREISTEKSENQSKNITQAKPI